MSIYGDYYVATHTNPDRCHEVHLSTCLRLPTAIGRIYIGGHPRCQDAIPIAQLYFGRICVGCLECSPDCASEH